jgi:hypothetical protein
MKWVRRSFIINTVILVGAFAFMAAGIGQLFQIFSDFDDLNKHEGVVASKFLYTKKLGKKDSINVIKLSLTDGQEYVVSRYSKKVDNLILIGDSIKLYTKHVSGLFGNYITNGNGKVWNTKNQQEVFHLTSNRYDSPLVDFEENQNALLKRVWIFPFCSLLFLGWFFYKRSGKKSPFIREWGG